MAWDSEVPAVWSLLKGSTLVCSQGDFWHHVELIFSGYLKHDIPVKQTKQAVTEPPNLACFPAELRSSDPRQPVLMQCLSCLGGHPAPGKGLCAALCPSCWPGLEGFLVSAGGTGLLAAF